MGCSASKPVTILNTKNPENHHQNPSISPSSESSNSSSSPPPQPNPMPKALSLSAPLVHHPPLRKGDTHHLVSLTSTTYGSLLLLDPPKTPPFHPPPKPKSEPEPEPALSPDSVINTWELMDGLDDDPDLLSSSLHRPINSCRFASSLNSFDSVPHSDYDDLFHSSSSFSSSSTATKPLWQHLSEESLLSKMDPNVVLTYRRALSSRQLGLKNYNHSKTRSLGCSPFGASSSSTWEKSPASEEKIIIYFTSLRGIRKTYEDCCTVRTIFRGFRVPVDERDVSMDSEFRKELERAVGGKVMALPRVFIKGVHIGGVEEIRSLHEMGELANLLEGFPVMESGFVCNGCGDARFVPCRRCNGSTKVFEEEEGGPRRCFDCNENGLIRCPACCS